MKNLVFLSIILAFFSAQAQTLKKVNHYSLDTLKSKIIWTGYAELGTYSPSGGIKAQSGEIEFKSGEIKSGNFIFDMKTLNHENKELEKHLKSEDFFNVHQFPTSGFKITRFNKNKVFGILMIKNQSHSISFPIKINTQDQVLIITGETKIDRTQFDIKYNSKSFFQDLGNYAIKNEFKLQFVLEFKAQDVK